MKNQCKRCKLEGKDSLIKKEIEKRSFHTVKKQSVDRTHCHNGIVYYVYGLCERFHYERLYKSKVIWDPCLRCKMKGVTKYKVPKDKQPASSNEEKLKTRVDELENRLEKYKQQIRILKQDRKLTHEMLDIKELLDICQYTNANPELPSPKKIPSEKGSNSPKKAPSEPRESDLSKKANLDSPKKTSVQRGSESSHSERDFFEHESPLHFSVQDFE